MDLRPKFLNSKAVAAAVVRASVSPVRSYETCLSMLNMALAYCHDGCIASIGLYGTNLEESHQLLLRHPEFAMVEYWKRNESAFWGARELR